MNLIEHLKNNGSTLSVSNVKAGTDIASKVVSLTKIVKEKVEREALPTYELRYSKANGFFDFYKSILTRLPELNEDGIGFAVIYDKDNNEVYLYLCSKENELGATPKIMATKQGKQKSLKFKSAALLYFGTQVNLFQDDTIMYRLIGTDVKNLFTIDAFTESVATKQLNLFVASVETPGVDEVPEEAIAEVQALGTELPVFFADELDQPEEEEDDVDDLKEEEEEENIADEPTATDFSYEEDDENSVDIMSIPAEDLFSILGE